MDPARPRADGIVIDGGLVVALEALPGAIPLPPGGVAIPGFVDPHVHLLAMAAARRSVDCSRAAAPNLTALSRVLAAASQGPGGWVRGSGFDEALVAERHSPGRALLDAAVPHRPLVVHHAAGTVAFCNAEALRRLGADPDAGDATPGVERDGSGRATGLVSKRVPLLDGVPALSQFDRTTALAEVGADLLAAGIVAVTDATATNDASAMSVLSAWTAGTPGPHLTVMPSARHLDEVAALSTTVVLGHAKVVIESDDPDDLDELVAGCRARGFPVALHVTDVDALDRALRALGAAGPGRRRDRLEHVSLCLPEQIAGIAAAGAHVVTQPAFVVERADKYADQLSPVEREWLYRLRTLLDAGIPVAASSDAPVVACSPLATVAAAVTGLPATERVDPATAVGLVTRSAAAASGTGGGTLRVGGRADLTVLGADPMVVPGADLAEIPVVATIVAGRVLRGGAELLGR